jgi:hypothetical protein
MDVGFRYHRGSDLFPSVSVFCDLIFPVVNEGAAIPAFSSGKYGLERRSNDPVVSLAAGRIFS